MSKESVLYKNIGVQTKGANIGVVGASGNIGDLLLGILDKHSQASMIKTFNPKGPKREVSKRVKVCSGKDGDVTSFEAVREFVKDLDFVACAIGALPPKIFDVEVGGMSNLVKASKETGRVKQILYISMLGVGKEIPDFEFTAKAKKQAEQHLIKSGIPYTIFRPSAFSFDLHRAFIFTIMLGYINIVANGKARLQPIDATNVAEIIAAAIGNKKAYNQIFNLGGKEVFSYRDLAEFYGGILDKKIEVRNLTDEGFRKLLQEAFHLPEDVTEGFLYRMKTDSILGPGDMEKLKETFPGIDELFIDFETRVRELLKRPKK